MLSTATYKLLKKDPTTTQEGRLNRKLKELGKKGEISGGYTIDSDPLATNLPGSTYGLLKIHKNGIPLRPIVSCIKAPFLSALQAHHLPHSPPCRQDSFTCEEFQALRTSDGRPKN